MKLKGQLAWYEDEDTVQFVVTVRRRLGHPLDARDVDLFSLSDVGIVRKAIIDTAMDKGLNLAVSGKRHTTPMQELLEPKNSTV